MKTATKLSLVIAIFSVVFTSCEKRITKVDSAFVGEWEAIGYEEGEHFRLIITENGKGEYEAYSFNDRIEYAKGVVRISDDDVIIVKNVRLRIQRYPSQVEDLGQQKTEAEWSMKARNLNFYRN